MNSNKATNNCGSCQACHLKENRDAFLVHVDPGVCRHYIQERERELARREAADAETCRQAIQMLEFAAENVDALPAAAHEAGGAEGLHIEGLLDRSECEQRLTLWRERLERLEAS